jgi:hypothetical protein
MTAPTCYQVASKLTQDSLYNQTTNLAAHTSSFYDSNKLSQQTDETGYKTGDVAPHTYPN